MRAHEEKLKRERDAKEMYASVVRNCEKSGTPVPPYEFLELIGKGAFGRVYKCKSQSGNLVAIKITNIDEEDFRADYDRMDETIRDFKKEVSILQQLKDSKTKNVNVIHDAFDLHSQLWIVADYCTGGSVRTLMRPFQREHMGLEEKYIIPIARELLIAIKGMHDIGIIHRDIKCANVYITEDGDIQLGDFGIVGVLEDNISSKRKTIVGTPHWMPKEIVDVMTGVETEEKPYGTEIDIWSYGCTLYEMASGAPPNHDVAFNEDLSRKLERAPRLRGDKYSSDLKDLVSYCLNQDPHARPTAEMILRHPYIANSSKRYPTSNLIKLVEDFKVWEWGGGSRSSLWIANPTDLQYAGIDADDDSEDDTLSSDGWNFSTSESFDEKVGKRWSTMHGVPPTLNLDPAASGLPPIKTQNLNVKERIQREHAEMSASRGEKSLERIFNSANPDPYSLHTPLPTTPLIQTPIEQTAPAQSSLPLREYTNDAPMRESIIDLGDADFSAAMASSGMTTGDSDFYDFTNEVTLKGPSRDTDDDDDENYPYGQFDDKRATMDWSFPSSEPAKPMASQEPDKRDTMGWTFATAGTATHDFAAEPIISLEVPPPSFDGPLPPGFRPTLDRTVTEPIGQFRGTGSAIPQAGPASASNVDDYRGSMIDLDLAFTSDALDFAAEIGRPSTATSSASAMTDETSGNPFDLEEDPLQNEIDRSRYSYHKQWRSEGGQLERRSHNANQAQLHTRGSSLTSNESFSGHRSSQAYQDLGPSDSLGIGLENGFSDDKRMTEAWPGFGALDNGTRFSRLKASPRIANFEFPYSGSSQANSKPSRSRDAGLEVLPGTNISLPKILPPNPSALTENDDQNLLEEELGRQMETLAESLNAMAKVLALHGNIDDGAYENDHRLSDLDAGFESTKENTEDSEESGPDFNTARHVKPRKMDLRSPALPQTTK